MSRHEEKKATGLMIAEKFFGLITLLIGALAFYYTSTSLGEIASSNIPQASNVAFFIQVFMYTISIGLIGLGIFLILAKTS